MKFIKHKLKPNSKLASADVIECEENGKKVFYLLKGATFSWDANSTEKLPAAVIEFYANLNRAEIIKHSELKATIRVPSLSYATNLLLGSNIGKTGRWDSEGAEMDNTEFDFYKNNGSITTFMISNIQHIISRVILKGK